MLSFLITCLIAAVLLYVFYLVLSLIPLPPPIRQIVYIIVGLVAVVWLLDFTNVFHLDLHRPLLR